MTLMVMIGVVEEHENRGGCRLCCCFRDGGAMTTLEKSPSFERRHLQSLVFGYVMRFRRPPHSSPSRSKRRSGW